MINNQNISATKEVISVAEHLPKLTKTILATVKGKKVNLTIDCPDQNLVVNIYRNYFDLMINNLIDNAIKFNDKETAEVTLSAKKENNNILLTVSDNGPGIAVEEQEKIFEQFYQTEKCFTGNVKGAGLGLPLVKKIVNAYGGKIEVKSELGQGATFTITLPA